MASKKYEMVEWAKRRTREELYKQAKQIFQNANRRLANLKKNGLLSPAYSAAMREGKFGARGKDYNALTHEYARAIAFLNMNTSTVAGAKSYESNLKSLVGDLTPNKRKLLFEAFKRIEQSHLTGVKNYGSTNLIQRISAELQNAKYSSLSELDKGTAKYEKQLDDLIEQMGKLAEEKYEEIEKMFRESSPFIFKMEF